MGAIFPYGKHAGKTLEWIIFHDPGYIVWILEDPDKRQPRKIAAEFDRLVERAAKLKIPGGCQWGCGGNPITQMCLHIHRASGGMGAVSFDCSKCRPDNNGWCMVRPSFLVCEIFRSYDKTGGKMLVDAIRSAYGLPKIMNQARMEEFFENDSNFDL